MPQTWSGYFKVLLVESVRIIAILCLFNIPYSWFGQHKYSYRGLAWESWCNKNNNILNSWILEKKVHHSCLFVTLGFASHSSSDTMNIFPGGECKGGGSGLPWRAVTFHAQRQLCGIRAESLVFWLSAQNSAPKSYHVHIMSNLNSICFLSSPSFLPPFFPSFLSLSLFPSFFQFTEGMSEALRSLNQPIQRIDKIQFFLSFCIF